MKYARVISQTKSEAFLDAMQSHYITIVASADILKTMKTVQLTIGFCAVSASLAFTTPGSTIHATRACENVNVGVGHNFRNPPLSLAAAAANSNALEGIGSPSNPGWESGRLNRLTEWADSSVPNRPIICEYQPKGSWLWRKWRGTVLKATWRSVVGIMLAGLALDFVARDYRLPYPLSWDIVAIILFLARVVHSSND